MTGPQIVKAERALFPWTKAIDDRVRSLCLSLKSAREIGKIIGATKNMVVGRCRRVGIRLPLTNGDGWHTVHGHRAAYNGRWSHKDDDQLRELVARGLRSTEVARHIKGRSTIAIRSRVKRIGCSFGHTGNANERASKSRMLNAQLRAAAPEESDGFVHQERFAEGYQGQHGRVSMMEVGPKQCRFPVEKLCCGLPTGKESSWCEAHAARVYNRGVSE